MASARVFVLGSFILDLVCRAPRLPRPGETALAGSFAMGPGGKGSNQAVAAHRAGGDVAFLTRLGRDSFAATARAFYAEEGMSTAHITEGDGSTGIALITVDEGSGENMITVAPGACLHIASDDLKAAAPAIRSARIFLTQFETNLEPVRDGLRIAAEAGVITILNPAPPRAACPSRSSMPFCNGSITSRQMRASSPR